MASNWTQIATDSFTRANVAPSASPGSIGSPAWVDNSPAGVFGITSNALIGTSADTNGYLHNTTLVRQSSESSLNTRVKLAWTSTANQLTVVPNRIEVALRWNGTAGASGLTGTFYMLQVTNPTSGTGALSFATVVNGVFGSLTNPTNTYTLANSHNYIIDAFAIGSSPTTLSATITDLTAGTVKTISFTDSTAGLQIAGVPGTLSYSPSGSSSSSPPITNITTFSNSTGLADSTLYTCSNTTLTSAIGVASAPVTLTPNFNGPGAITTVTLSDGGAGGTFIPTAVTFASGDNTPQTFTYTPAGSSATITLTNNQGLVNPATIAVTAGSASISISPTTIAARQPAPSVLAATPAKSPSNLGVPTTGGVTVTVTGSGGTNFTSLSQFRLTGGFGATGTDRTKDGTGGASLIGGTITDTSHATLIFDPGPFFQGNPYGTSGATTWGTITITDSGSSTSATLTVTAPTIVGTTNPPTTAPATPTTPTIINTVYLGDSITATDVAPQLNPYGDTPLQATLALKRKGVVVQWSASAAVDGSWTQQWLPTPTYSHNTTASGNNYAWWMFADGISHVDNTTFPFDSYSDPGCYIKRMLDVAAYARGAGTRNTTVGPNDYVHIMLYTNEITGNTTHPKGPLSVAQHHTFMSQLVAYLVGLGWKVILSKPPYTWPYANPASALPWPPHDCSHVTVAGWIANGFVSYPNNYPHEIYQQMWQADQSLIDGVHVFKGDETAYEYSQTNPATFLQIASDNGSPGVHPRQQAIPLYGEMWANGILNAVGGGSGGGGTSPTQAFIAGPGSTPVSTSQTLTFFLDQPAIASTQITVTCSGVGTVTQPSAIGIGSIGPVTCTFNPGVTAGTATIGFTNNAGLSNTGSPKTITVSSSGGGISNPWTHG